MGSQSVSYGAVLLQYREVVSEDGLVEMRSSIKMLSADLGFSLVNQTKIVTAASELGRNVIEHGLGGSVKIEQVQSDERVGIRLIFADSGPGIEDIDLALSDGYTSKKGLGLGLSGSKRLMDEFEIQSAPGQGTTVTVTKWT
jgi:serine/threonine-protein kinase RsbT